MRAVRSGPLQGGSHRNQGSVVSKPGQESRRCHRTLAGAEPQRHTAPGAAQTHASDTVVATPTDTAQEPARRSQASARQSHGSPRIAGALNALHGAIYPLWDGPGRCHGVSASRCLYCMQQGSGLRGGCEAAPGARNMTHAWLQPGLDFLANPQVALILLMVGIYGLFYELMSPGLAVPGVVGLICLLLGLYAFQMLPVNWAGVGLIALGTALMIAEAFVPAFGAAGVAGVAAFVLGGTLLSV